MKRIGYSRLEYRVNGVQGVTILGVSESFCFGDWVMVWVWAALFDPQLGAENGGIARRLTLTRRKSDEQSNES